jgi:hypothetical protein
MLSYGILKSSEAFSYVSAGLHSCFVVLVVNLLTFLGSEKALDNRIVVAIAVATHADLYLVVF